MDINEIMFEAIGTSPFVAFLTWFIITERKAKKDSFNEMKSIYSQCQQKNANREDKVFDALMANHEVLKATQDIMLNLSQKYDDIKIAMIQGFSETNTEIKNVYRNCSMNKCKE